MKWSRKKEKLFELSGKNSIGNFHGFNKSFRNFVGEDYFPGDLSVSKASLKSNSQLCSKLSMEHFKRLKGAFVELTMLVLAANYFVVSGISDLLRIQLHPAFINLHVDLILAQHQVLLVDLQRRLLVNKVTVEQINRCPELANLLDRFGVKFVENIKRGQNRFALLA